MSCLSGRAVTVCVVSGCDHTQHVESVVGAVNCRPERSQISEKKTDLSYFRFHRHYLKSCT